MPARASAAGSGSQSLGLCLHGVRNLPGNRAPCNHPGACTCRKKTRAAALGYDAAVSLFFRLLLAIGLLSIATTALFAFIVRGQWQKQEELNFDWQSKQIAKQVESDVMKLEQAVSVASLCDKEPVLDEVIVGLRSGDLDERRTRIKPRVDELMPALRLDELVLITSDGLILGAGHDTALIGTRDRALARRVGEQAGKVSVREGQGPLALETSCIHKDKDSPARWAGLFSARRLQPVIDQIAASSAVTLGLNGVSTRAAGAPSETAEAWVRSYRIEQLGGMPLSVARSKAPLEAALLRLDETIAKVGFGTFLGALVVAVLLSRGLAKPLADLARETREVVRGEPKAINPRGARELVELAEAFNRTIADLVSLRKRLASTERIAARREIARRVAHEIKNLRAPIRAAVETLRRLRSRQDPAFDEYFEEATRTVLDEVARISNIVSEFTQFARLPRPAPKPFDAVDAVRGVVALHSSSGVQIDMQATTCPELNADRDQLVQVLTNLLQNAIHAAKSSAAPHVWVTMAAAGDLLTLSVRDNGPGVPPEMRDRLFEPYATTKAEGTGLGLAIVERIVVEHGGEIAHVDPPSGGTEFIVTLPIAGPPVLPDEPPPSSRAA
jgi:signal transduction histidine kinase